jgi:hypothetical protein
MNRELILLAVGCSMDVNDILDATMNTSRASRSTRSSAPSKKKRSVTVLLLLRHGEREDEAVQRHRSVEERRRTALMPNELQSAEMVDTLDPPLTALGYEQAMEAWRNIICAIMQQQHHYKQSDPGQDHSQPKRRAQVTLVCSPLRRCIGTAMMIVSALPMVECGGEAGMNQEDSPSEPKRKGNVTSGSNITETELAFNGVAASTVTTTATTTASIPSASADESV